jgi:hypothetical protein
VIRGKFKLAHRLPIANFCRKQTPDRQIKIKTGIRIYTQANRQLPSADSLPGPAAAASTFEIIKGNLVMQAAVLFLAIVAYGDSSDYIPAAASRAAKSVQRNTSDFIDSANKSTEQFRNEIRERQRKLDLAFDTNTPQRPAPMNSGNVRRVSGNTATTTAANSVIQAQHQMNDTWPNRGIDGAGYDKNRAATDPTDVNSSRPFSLSAPASTTASSTTNRRQNASGASRYIPANATGNTAPGSPNTSVTAPPRAARQMNTSLPDPNAQRTPRFIANDNTSEFAPPSMDADRNSGGDFNPAFGSTADTARPDTSRRNTRSTDPSIIRPSEPDFDLGTYNNRRQTQTQTPAPTQTTVTQTPTNTRLPSTAQTAAPRGGTYLPPNSTSYPANVDRGTPDPRVVAPQNPWPTVAQNPPRNPNYVAPTTTTSPPPITTIPVTQRSGYQPIATTTTQPATNQNYVQRPTVGTPRIIQGGSYFMTLLMLMGSIGLNLYLGWIAWDTYNRYQDMVADIRYSGPRREPMRDDFVERVA